MEVVEAVVLLKDGSAETFIGKRRVDDLRRCLGDGVEEETGASGEAERAGAEELELSFLAVVAVAAVVAVEGEVARVGEPPVFDDVEAEDAVDRRREDVVTVGDEETRSRSCQHHFGGRSGEQSAGKRAGVGRDESVRACF